MLDECSEYTCMLTEVILQINLSVTVVTAMSIMAQLFLNFHSSNATIDAVSDNQGVINRCASAAFHQLKKHQEKI